ncbi:MAG: GIY-YIG nuclease family protein [Planctomycetaceae bacterium]|jgi:hypothetical protein|nr:GIY-YIG nuclease family protein [Planctomycetaceae bacterium]
MKRKLLIAFAILLTAVALAIAAAPPKAGYVYVISNIGSFGPDVYKVGYTQRKPEDRIKELGDSSVPFPFDIHVVIETDDVLGLERAIHKDLDQYRVNKANARKEFFRCDLDIIVETIRRHHPDRFEVIREPKATEWRGSKVIP